MKKLLCLVLILSFICSLISCDFGPTSTINGNNLKKYQIVYSDEDSDYSKRAAEYIKAEILERTGLDLPVVEDDAKAEKYEIVVGETSRDISKKLDAKTENVDFAIMAEGNNVALEGDYFIIAAAAYFFIETYVPADGFNAVIPEQVSIHSPVVEKADNFIMLIGDGMGPIHTKIFEYVENTYDFSDGENRFYGYYLPHQGQSRTNSLSGVTDSAAGGTALSSGTKTINGLVGRDKDGKDLKLLTELARDLDKAAGVMSTEPKTGATPASFSAHADSRHGTAEIIMTQKTAREKYGIVINCGYDYTSVEGIGMIEDEITLMLDTLDDNENGFFLMYEEAYIDKHSHNNDLDKTYEAVVRFNQAIGRFMEYAFYNPNTFILITADHETGDLFPNDKGELEYHSGDHTSKNVPVFAYGYGSECFDGVSVENIQIAHTFAHFMGVDDFGDQSKYSYIGK